MMKAFLIVLITSVINFAQTPNVFLGFGNSVQEMFPSSLKNYSLNAQSPITYFILTNNNFFADKDSIHQRMDSIISNSVTGDKLKLLFEYDQNDNIIEQLSLGWVSGIGWTNGDKNEYCYDENQKLVLHLNLEWNVSNWDSLFRINYFYNPQGQLIYYIIQEYVDSTWENYLRVSFEYDLYGNEFQRKEEEWQNGWVNKFLYTNYYSNIVRRDSLHIQVWKSANWADIVKTYFYYNQKTQFLESFLYKIWVGGNWENNIYRNITNDENGNQIIQVDQLWNGANWDNLIRRFYSFDEFNYTLSAYCELWNGTQWYPDDGLILIENPDGFIVGFDGAHNVFIYYVATGILDEVNSLVDNFVLYQNYPNPFNSSTTIKYKIQQSGEVTLQIFDVLGNVITTIVDEYQTTGSYEVVFQSENLSSGIYFYRLQADNFIATKKLILLK